jgi:prepilin-type N-terminal cleavage/methylation domain-containing protein
VRRRGHRTGFTLLELVAALALTGLVLAGVWRLIGELGDHRDRSALARARAFAAANGVGLLRDVISQVEGVTEDSAAQFVGLADSAAFESWCAVPGGWAERCRATLRLIRKGDSAFAMLTLRDAPAMLAWGLEAKRATLLYGEVMAGTLVWQKSWGRTVRPPAALAMTTASDTVVFPIGSR